MPPLIVAVLGEPSAAKGGLLLAGAAVLVVGSWLGDRARANRIYCPECGGSGKRRSSWRGGAFGACRACDGTGHRRRIL